MKTLTSPLIPEEELQKRVLTLDIFSESIVAQNHTTGQTFEVNPDSLVNMFSGLVIRTGLLEPGIVAYENVKGATKKVVLIKAGTAKVEVELANSGIVNFEIPYPPLVFVGVRDMYFLFAIKSTEISNNTPLFHAPFPNVGSDGKICFGSARVPTVGKEAIRTVFDGFLSSRFNNDLSAGKSSTHPSSILDLWVKINGCKRFPSKELVAYETHRIGDLISN